LVSIILLLFVEAAEVALRRNTHNDDHADRDEGITH
jgi:hypothetical protein